MPMTAPRRASSCWRAARSATCRNISGCDRFRVMDDRRWNARGELVTESEATITLEIGEQQRMTVATATARSTRSTPRCARRCSQSIRSSVGHAARRLQGPHPDAGRRHRRGHARHDRKRATGRRRAGARSASRRTSSMPPSTRCTTASAGSCTARRRGCRPALSGRRAPSVKSGRKPVAAPRRSSLVDPQLAREHRRRRARHAELRRSRSCGSSGRATAGRTSRPREVASGAGAVIDRATLFPTTRGSDRRSHPRSMRRRRAIAA